MNHDRRCARAHHHIRWITAVLISVCVVQAFASVPALALTPTRALQASPSDACSKNGTLNCPGTDGDGYVYIYDPANGTIVTLPVADEGSRDPAATYAYAVTPDCPQARPLEDIDCAGAAEFCTSQGTPGVHEDIWRMETAPITSPWGIVGRICTGTLPASLPVQQITSAVGEYEHDHMPLPTVTVQPSTVAIVNLPVLVSVDPLPPQMLQVQQPLPGLLLATPTITWTFSDGGTATGPGTKYDGTDPRADPAHYASHTYLATDEHASVTLTVTWNATFTAAGHTFTIAPLVMPPTKTNFSVREAHAVLVSG